MLTPLYAIRGRRIDNIEKQVEHGFSKLTHLLSRIDGTIKEACHQPQTFEQLTSRWNQIERIPCMCCETKNNNNTSNNNNNTISSASFDKSFNSREEGKELLCSASDANLLIHSLSLDGCDDDEMAEDRDATEMSVLVESGRLAELVRPDESSNANTLHHIASFDTAQHHHQQREETSRLLLNHSEPILSLCPSNRSPQPRPRTFARSKSLSLVWFRRLASLQLPQMWKHP